MNLEKGVNMRITKITHGWKVEYSTSEEKSALQFILDAFEETYCKSVPSSVISTEKNSVEAEVSQSAIDLQPSLQNQKTVESV